MKFVRFGAAIAVLSAVALVGSDGSIIHGHFDQHVTITPTGATISFDHLVC